jgi:hypothetical protein
MGKRELDLRAPNVKDIHVFLPTWIHLLYTFRDLSKKKTFASKCIRLVLQSNNKGVSSDKELAKFFDTTRRYANRSVSHFL